MIRFLSFVQFGKQTLNIRHFVLLKVIPPYLLKMLVRFCSFAYRLYLTRTAQSVIVQHFAQVTFCIKTVELIRRMDIA